MQTYTLSLQIHSTDKRETYEVGPLICPSPLQKILYMEVESFTKTLNQTPNSTPHSQNHINQFDNFIFSACSHPVKPSVNT